MPKKRKLAIIGVGPRGLHAFENIVHKLREHNALGNVQVLLFEETPNIGNGPVYDTMQARTNWINITERALKLPERPAIDLPQAEILAFPSFHQWAGKDYDLIPDNVDDHFPTRAHVGKYLSERFDALYSPLAAAGIAELVNERVEEIVLEDKQFFIRTPQQKLAGIDEVLLTIGHQPTEPSEQMQEWQNYAGTKENAHLFDYPYPVSHFINSEKLDSGSTVAMRGFGLAMIDVARAVAEKFGKFVRDEGSNKIRFEADAQLTNVLVPFSLDGLPMAPKPLNAKIDGTFRPTEERIAAFGEQIGNKENQQKATGTSFIIDAISPLAAEVFLAHGYAVENGTTSWDALLEVIKNWLKDDHFDHSMITPTNQPALKTMRQFIAMARGDTPTTLEYCVCHVWKHCQPTIYEQLSHNECSEEAFAEIIKLDERLKRYTYGPPVESIEQMVALVEFGAMTLDFVKDPDFELTNAGWKMTCGDKSITADMMINSVLDAPKLKVVNSSVIEHLLEDKLIQAVHDELGILTNDDGFVISKDTERVLPLAVLGRLAKGTVIGVDAILECFGVRSRVWAEKAAANHLNWVKKTAAAEKA